MEEIVEPMNNGLTIEELQNIHMWDKFPELARWLKWPKNKKTIS
jgi:hypothetical protein